MEPLEMAEKLLQRENKLTQEEFLFLADILFGKKEYSMTRLKTIYERLIGYGYED